MKNANKLIYSVLTVTAPRKQNFYFLRQASLVSFGKRTLINSINWSSVFAAVSLQMKVVEESAPENASGNFADGDNLAGEQGLFRIGQLKSKIINNEMRSGERWAD